MTHTELERAARAVGFTRVCGVDEAGRGALAGPLVVAAAILPPEDIPTGIADSKALRHEERVEILHELHRARAHIAVVIIPADEVDHYGVQACNMRGFRQAVAQLSVQPEYVLCDGFRADGIPYPSLGVKKGDSVEACMAAASIAAKVARDTQMQEIDTVYPQYGFAQHKGYGTLSHRSAIESYGFSPVHRRSFCKRISTTLRGEEEANER